MAPMRCQGAEGLTDWSRQLLASGAQVWHTFPSLMHRNLPRTETATLTTGGAGTLRDSGGERHWPWHICDFGGSPSTGPDV